MGVNPPKKYGSFQVFYIITHYAINDILAASFIRVVADGVKKEEKLPNFAINFLPSADNINEMESAMHEYIGILWAKLFS